METTQSKPQTGSKRVRAPRASSYQAPEMLFFDEVAQALRVSLSTIKRLVKTGELRVMKVAGINRVSRFDLERYLRSCRVVPAPAPQPEPQEPARSDLAELIGLAVLDAFEQGRGVYLANREGIDTEIARYVLGPAQRRDVAPSEGALQKRLVKLWRDHNASSGVAELDADELDPDELETIATALSADAAKPAFFKELLPGDDAEFDSDEP